ncbi:MAG: hypothetical protein JO033_27970, partial [Acidobacteriaceae bacterium]|nr:hypothetical protein [Acidobacteriaceae bacterium]
MQLGGKNVVVVGTKRSGLAAAKLLRERGACVRAMEERPLTPEERAPFDALGV